MGLSVNLEKVLTVCGIPGIWWYLIPNSIAAKLQKECTFKNITFHTFLIVHISWKKI